MTLHYLDSSGKSVNDLGDYRACIDSTEFPSLYYIAMLKHKSYEESFITYSGGTQVPRNLKIGMCVP